MADEIIKIKGKTAFLNYNGRVGSVSIDCQGEFFIAYWHKDWPNFIDDLSPIDETELFKYLSILKEEVLQKARREIKQDP